MTTQIISTFTARSIIRATAELLAPYFENANDTDNAHAIATSVPAILTAPFFQNVNDTDNAHAILAIVADDLAAPFFQNVNDTDNANTIRAITFADLTAPLFQNVNDTDNTHLIASDVDGYKYWKALGFYQQPLGITYSAIGGFELQSALGTDLFDTALADPLTRGDRTASITVTTSGSMAGTASTLVNGDYTGSGVVTSGNGYATFDFGSAKLLTDAWCTLLADDVAGTWQWKGSSDGTTFTNVSAVFTMDAASSGRAAVSFGESALRENLVPYRHWRIERTGGAGTFTLREFQFLFDGNAILWNRGDGSVDGRTLYRTGAQADHFAVLGDGLAGTYLSVIAPDAGPYEQAQSVSTQPHQLGFRFSDSLLPDQLYWQQPSADFDKAYKHLRLYGSNDGATWSLYSTVDLSALTSGGSATYQLSPDNEELDHRVQRVYAEITNELQASGGSMHGQRVYVETTNELASSGQAMHGQRLYSEISYDLDIVIGPDPNPANDHAEDPALITTPPATNVQLWDVGSYRTARVYGGGVEGQLTNTYHGAMARNPIYGKKMWGYRAGMFNGGNNNTTNVTMGATAKATPLSSVSLGSTGAVAKGNGSIWADGVEVAVAGTLPAMTSRDIVYYVAYDATSKKIWFGSGNASGGAITWVGDPVAGTGQSHTMTVGQGDYFYPFSQIYTTGHAVVASFSGAVSGSPNPDVGFWTPAAAPTGFSYFNAP